jgi:hypothetical protein
MKKAITAVVVMMLSGCATHPVFNITASTPAYIEIDGVIRCKTTPCTITPPHWVGPFKECKENASMQSVLTAFPIDKSKGFVQQKQIRAMCNDNKTVYFDMEARSGVQTITGQ